MACDSCWNGYSFFLRNCLGPLLYMLFAFMRVELVRMVTLVAKAYCSSMSTAYSIKVEGCSLPSAMPWAN
jgi:hypothetical protein